MPIAPSAQHLRINSATVITDQNAKIAGRVVNLNLNLARARVAKCIHKGFAANAVHLVANNGMQRSWQAFHDDAKVNLLLNDKFLRNAGKRLSEVAVRVGLWLSAAPPASYENQRAVNWPQIDPKTVHLFVCSPRDPASMRQLIRLISSVSR